MEMVYMDFVDSVVFIHHHSSSPFTSGPPHCFIPTCTSSFPNNHIIPRIEDHTAPDPPTNFRRLISTKHNAVPSHHGSRRLQPHLRSRRRSWRLQPRRQVQRHQQTQQPFQLDRSLCPQRRWQRRLQLDFAASKTLGLAALLACYPSCFFHILDIHHTPPSISIFCIGRRLHWCVAFASDIDITFARSSATSAA